MTQSEKDRKLVEETDFIHKYLRAPKTPGEIKWNITHDKKHQKYGRKIGVVVAMYNEQGHIVSGWSVCSDKDHFGRIRGKATAIRRAYAYDICVSRGFKNLMCVGTRVFDYVISEMTDACEILAFRDNDTA